MRIKFEMDGAICLTPCPYPETRKIMEWTEVCVNSAMCSMCPDNQGTEGNEVICGREEKE